MALTEAEFRQRAKQRLRKVVQAELTLSDITGEFGPATAEQKARFLAAVQAGDEKEIGEAVLSIVFGLVDSTAQTEADALDINALTLQQVNRILLGD